MMLWWIRWFLKRMWRYNGTCTGYRMNELAANEMVCRQYSPDNKTNVKWPFSKLTIAFWSHNVLMCWHTHAHTHHKDYIHCLNIKDTELSTLVYNQSSPHCHFNLLHHFYRHHKCMPCKMDLIFFLESILCLVLCVQL